MGTGIYTAPERVERDGVLVCFAGERMTYDEAAKRGLHVPAAPPAAPRDERRAELMKLTAAKLAQKAAELGCACPKGATKAVLAEAVLDAEEGAK